MFEFATQSRSDGGQPRRGVAFGVSAIFHIGLVVAVTVLAVSRPPKEETAPVDVKFVRAGAAGSQHNAPPPPPPPKKKFRPHAPTKIVAPVVVPQRPPDPQPQAPTKQEEADDDDDDGSSDDGVEGGVPGGVKGGVVGGVVGNPLPAVAPPKNVPAFVMDKEILQRPLPRLSEVFKQSHRRIPVSGMYKVCVGTDGHVFDVIAVKSVPGADEDIVSGIKDGWLYKTRQVPVCFLYNFAITITE
jgi:periplasmic protein TonB